MEQIRLGDDKLKAILTNEGIYFVKGGPPAPENIFLHMEYSRLYDTSYYYEGKLLVKNVFTVLDPQPIERLS